MKYLYIIRHGQSDANAHKIVAGSQDSPLSELGRLQSTLAGQNAKRFFHFDLIATSPMQRTRETAALLASELALPPSKILALQHLRERDLGEREGISYAATNQQYSGNYEDIENTPGIEPLEALYARAQQALEELRKRPEEAILIIAHNGIGRMLRVVIDGGEPLDLYKQARLENAIIYRLT